MRPFIPPEIDDLMWTVAEENNDSAIQEFGDRYPQYRSALEKRLLTVKGLKSAKKPTEPRPVSPKFVPKERLAPDTSSWIRNVAVGLGLLALAALAFVITSLVTPEPKSEMSTEIPATSAENPASSPAITGNPRPSVPIPKPIQVPEPTDERANVATTRRISLSVKGATLRTIFALIEKEAKIRIVAPDSMQDAVVDASYRDMSPMEILSTMGQLYNFTALDQYDGSVVILPVRAGSTENPTTQTNENRRRIGG